MVSTLFFCTHKYRSPWPPRPARSRPPALQPLAPSRRWPIVRFSSANLDEWSDFAVLLQLLNHPLAYLPRTRMPKSGHLFVFFYDSIFFFLPFRFALLPVHPLQNTLVCPPSLLSPRSFLPNLSATVLFPFSFLLCREMYSVRYSNSFLVEGPAWSLLPSLPLSCSFLRSNRRVVLSTYLFVISLASFSGPIHSLLLSPTVVLRASFSLYPEGT